MRVKKLYYSLLQMVVSSASVPHVCLIRCGTVLINNHFRMALASFFAIISLSGFASAEVPLQTLYPELGSYCKIKLEHMARDKAPMDSCRPCFANCIVGNKDRDKKNLCLEICDQEKDYDSLWNDMMISNREIGFCKDCQHNIEQRGGDE
jgi:hypothetical protein